MMENDVAKYFMPGLMVVIAMGLVVFYALDIRQRSKAEQKRANSFFQLAGQLGLTCQPIKDTELPRRYFFVRQLDLGENRFARNSLTGDYSGHQVCVFDYHYEIKSATGDERTSDDSSILIMHVAAGDQLAEFPRLTIAREGPGGSFAEAFGVDDISFESLEFSRMFRVHSKDKKFAYDVCYPRMMEYLMVNPDLTLEYNLYTIAMIFNRRLKPEEIRPNLDRLLEVRSLLPNYVLTPA